MVSVVLAKEWCDVLGVQEVRPDDDFFELGGTSLLAVALMERIEERLDIEFPFESLFLDGTFGSLVDGCLAQVRRRGPVSAGDGAIDAG